MHIIRLIHKWTGFVIGLSFLLSCLSGAFICIGKLSGSYAPFFTWTKQLHTTLCIGSAGSTIIGIATLLGIIEIITGYWLWGRTTSSLVRSYRRKGKNSCSALRKTLGFTFPDKIRGTHAATGVWGGLPLLIMILTGLTWSFGWYNTFVYALFDSPSSGSWDSNLFHTLHALHVGSWGGVFSRILWTVGALFGTATSFTGLWLFFKRAFSRH